MTTSIVRDFTTVAEITIDPATARVFENGWQSWSPTSWYRVGEPAFRPVTHRNQLICYRPEVTAPLDEYWGEGILAVSAGPEGPSHVIGATDITGRVPSIRARVVPGTLTRLVISADGPVSITSFETSGERALASWAERLARKSGVGRVADSPTLWSHWYHYFNNLDSGDIRENLDAMERLELDVDVVAIDDGYQTGIGDWLDFTPGFADFPDLMREIQDRGRRAGVWMAPWLVGEKSQLAAAHPDWLVRGANDEPIRACHNWHQEQYALDTTHPDAADWLRSTVRQFASWGIDFYKLDFIFAGAIEGRRHDDVDGVTAYRRGLELVREGMGPDGYLLACGAPMLPSIGMVDSMRVSADIDRRYAPSDGDLSQPSQQGAVLSGVGRAFMHGRFWANDADCLTVGVDVERREEWASHVRRYTGLRGSSDRLGQLDDWGIDTTRQLLRQPAPEVLIDAADA